VENGVKITVILGAQPRIEGSITQEGRWWKNGRNQHFSLSVKFNLALQDLAEP